MIRKKTEQIIDDLRQGKKARDHNDLTITFNIKTFDAMAQYYWLR